MGKLELRVPQDRQGLVLDAGYEKIREEGVIRNRAVLVAIGINWEGRRCVLGVEVANRESQSRRLNEELKRRTLVVRIFPNTASCLRLIRGYAAVR